MRRRWRLILAALSSVAVALPAYLWAFHGRYQYEPLCPDGDRTFDGPLDPVFMGAFIDILHELQGVGTRFDWDGELLVKDRRIYFNRFGIDPDLPLNAANRSVRYLVERRLAAGWTLPDFVLAWRAIFRQPASERSPVEEEAAFCPVLQWVALDRSSQETAGE